MITLLEAKEWLRIDLDYKEEDNLIESLIRSSIAIIKRGTGISKEYIISTRNEDLKELYIMAQRIIIENVYNEKDTENKALTSYLIQLEVTYKEDVSHAVK